MRQLTRTGWSPECTLVAGSEGVNFKETGTRSMGPNVNGGVLIELEGGFLWVIWRVLCLDLMMACPSQGEMIGLITARSAHCTYQLQPAKRHGIPGNCLACKLRGEYETEGPVSVANFGPGVLRGLWSKRDVVIDEEVGVRDTSVTGLIAADDDEDARIGLRAC
ncbi:hypothetical protein JB92DRAFT_2835573 [Gautieria morchelliformis]|nr:hypothetical protein JB92DRAFT_2835573 [Gautieria morchelliformis]